MTKLSLARMAGVVFVSCFVAIVSSAQTLTTLASFDDTDGALPYSSLVQGFDGNLYGTTFFSGVNQEACGLPHNAACGTVYRVTPEGTLTAIYSFCSQPDCADGTGPTAALVPGTDGNLYGTATYGGITTVMNVCFVAGCGTVFKITPAGELTVLYRFCAETNCADGANPFFAGLVQGTDGNFYGTTSGGGNSNALCPGGQGFGIGCGTLFRISPTGALKTLYRFCSIAKCADGVNPQATLFQGRDGNFYGTTRTGGAKNGGTVFRITPGGELTTLYSFCSELDCFDGENPNEVTQGSDGNFYGTTLNGPSGGGTIFRITPGGNLTTLGNVPGGLSWSGLTPGTDGDFYGTGYSGGPSCSSSSPACGTVFKITPEFTTTILNGFDGADGGDLFAGVVQSTNGKFYGATSYGAASPCLDNGCGTVFSLGVGLSPFVKFLPAARPVGQTVEILGQGFTGTTAVSFNGTPATFTVRSETHTTATVPVGATTGKIMVTTPSGVLQSNRTFLVRPQILSFSPPSGSVGASVVITGESFTGATEVTFPCGKRATFTVDSNTQITATVPAGAMTGEIGVYTPGGNVGTSSVFTVTP